MVRSNSRQIRLPSISTRLKEINAARVDLLRQLEELDAELCALHREHGSIINENAAISALPSELLSAIFQVGHNSQAPGGHFERLVSSVTQHWRDIALATPKLWAVISCVVFRQHHEAMALYLCRSKAAPIELIIKIEERGTDVKTVIHDWYREYLSSHIARCNRLVVDATRSNYLGDIIELLYCLYNASAPLLRRINISCPYEWPQHDVSQAPAQILTGGTPLLNEISLQGIGLQCCLPLLDSVTTIYLHGISVLATSDEWTKVLSSAPSLIHLEIDGGR